MDHAITAAELLNVWEQGRSLGPVERALALLSVAAPAEERTDLEELSIGERDRRLIELHEAVFGARILGQTDCPACRQQIELEFDTSDVNFGSASPQSSTFEISGHEIQFRFPNSSDLSALPPDADVLNQKRVLARRCVLSATHRGVPVPDETLTDGMISAISDRMSELDPQGDVQLNLLCPECGHAWQAPLDIASFVWVELNTWAIRLLRDVHVIAVAYGWREAAILALTPQRRAIYLELIQR